MKIDSSTSKQTKKEFVKRKDTNQRMPDFVKPGQNTMLLSLFL